MTVSNEVQALPQAGPTPSSTTNNPRRLRLATIWLGGCSGCHMSFLDLDERLLDLFAAADLVYSPIVDTKHFPDEVDVTLVEGSVCNEENRELLLEVREKSRFVVAFGDCAVTGNVTAMRNSLGSPLPVLERSYLAPELYRPALPHEPGIVPPLLPRAVPLHDVVEIDFHLPGCPPSADLIHFVLCELLAGRVPNLSQKLKFG